MTTATNTQTIGQEIRGALDVLFEPDSLVEVRLLQTRRGTVSGYFADRDALVEAVEAWDGKAPAIYVTLNPVNPDLLARAVNRLREHAKETTQDTDIIGRRWLPLDFDPKRSPGISSTNAEHAAALHRAEAVRDWLAGGGWPDPLLIDSGNGAHLLYRVDLPNTPDALQLVTRCLEALAFQFSDGAVTVDLKVANAARIWKLPGTMACKGDSTPDRPHRRARILEAPARLTPVPMDLLEGLAAQVPKAENNGHKPGGLGSFDLPAWIAEHGLPVASTGGWNGGTKWVVNPCPWNPEHTNRSAYIVQHASGAIAAGCHHNGCAGKGWHELRDVIEPGWRGVHATVAGEAPAEATAEAEPLRVPDAGLIGVARDFADLYAEYLESPRSFFYFSFLTYFGALVAKQITLDSQLLPEPRLYVVVLGESADTRKSTALRMTDQFFRSLGPEWEPPVNLGVGSAEGLAAELKDRPGHSVILYLDELKALVDKCRAESSVLLPMVTSLFERDAYDNRTKDGSISLRGVSLSLLAACTQETYATMFDSRFLSIGFLNRLWLVVDRTTASIPVPQQIPTLALDTLRARVKGYLQAIGADYRTNGHQAVPYIITPAALDQYRDWYQRREGSVFERRLDAYAHRLMVLLAATSGRTEVDEDVMEAVLALVRYQLDARRECDPVDADNAIAVLEERIRRALARGAMKGRDIKRKLHADRAGVWMWRTAVQNLVGTGELKWDAKLDLYWLEDHQTVTTTVTTSMVTDNGSE